MFIYVVSCSVFREMGLCKIGMTENLYGRRSTYLTGCPPGLTPSHDIEYDAVWETTATTRDQLFDFEDEVHNYFLKYRMMRDKPGDSEWFNFQGKTPLAEVSRFMDTRPWVKRLLPLVDIAPKKSPYLRKQYHKNLHFIKSVTERNAALNLIQAPVITAIAAFMADPSTRAGYVIAPCGSGKTIMTTKGIHGVRKCVICCPSKQIQNQWKSTLLLDGVSSDIVGDAGTTDPDAIRALFEQDSFCVISTYMSSHLLLDHIAGVELLVLDEAHHMAGVVTEDEGRTRKLLSKASSLDIKRLSLTYTPRIITESDATFLTMDDAAIFGAKIAELKIRDLIRKGVLPDYRLWTLRDDAKKGTGILGKAECILQAWGSTEIVRGEEKHILHHLVVFAATTKDAKELELFFKEKTTDTVLRVEQGDRLEEPIAQFTAAPRAILINCFVLNEGVDIPIANAVAITYPKQSRGQITQMVLRAGRWYPGKAVFHILIPTLGDEDLSGFEEVLSALASCDDQIRDEIVLRTKPGVKPSDPLPSSETGETLPECIMIEEFEADEEEIRRCFRSIRRNFCKGIQELCVERGVDTSTEYALLRLEFPELPEDPRPKKTLWYDYLHPTRGDQITGPEFVEILQLNNVVVSTTYDEWRGVQPTDVIAKLPTLQNISDGFFGENMNFDILITKFQKEPHCRR
jgi:superfamily II DNA or RNA helicase